MRKEGSESQFKMIKDNGNGLNMKFNIKLLL